MIAARTSLVLAVSLLGACTTPAGFGFDEQRTVFNNPYVPPVIDPGTTGPRCDAVPVRRSVCTSGAILYPGGGRHALLPNGEIIRLTRAERRFLRDRADALEAQRDVFESLANGTPLPPGSPALPREQGGGSGPVPPPTVPPSGPPTAGSGGAGRSGGGREADAPR